MRQPHKHKPHAALTFKPPRYMRNIRRGLTTLAVLIAVSIVYTLYWVGMAYQFRQSLDTWMEARRAEGYRVSHAGYRLGGYPLVFRMNYKEPSIAPPGDPPPWTWRGETASAEARPWSPWRMALHLPGAHQLDIVSADGVAAYQGDAGELTVEFPVAGGWPPEGSLSVRDLDLKSGSGRIAVVRAVLYMERLSGGTAGPNTATAALRLKSEGVTAPGGASLPLGAGIAHLTLEASVLGAIPEGPWPQALAPWRDGGGTLEIKRLDAVYGPLILKAGGTMAVDADTQPIGAFTAKVQGFFEAIEDMRKGGFVSGRDAVTATVVLGALARKTEGGGPSTLNLAITIQDRKIYAGPVALADLPAIPWGDAKSKGPKE